MNPNRYTNAEMVDIQLVYVLAKRKGRAAVPLYGETNPTRRRPDHQLSLRCFKTFPNMDAKDPVMKVPGSPKTQIRRDCVASCGPKFQCQCTTSCRFNRKILNNCPSCSVGFYFFASFTSVSRSDNAVISAR